MLNDINIEGQRDRIKQYQNKYLFPKMKLFHTTKKKIGDRPYF